MPHTAVVFVSYLKVPESRLQEHFAWNDEVYRHLGDQLRVYVVSDVEHDLPDYAETVLFPIERLPVVNGEPRFSLSMTKNAGIQQAIDDGAGVIICTDVDIAYGWKSINRMVAVEHTRAVIPIYLMSASFRLRFAGRQDHGCTGTIGMTAANWERVQFDERCVGYGGEDGILLRAIERAGIDVARDCEVAHIAHVPGDGVRIPGRGAATCWGRMDGFNFENARYNLRFHRRSHK